MSSDKEKLTLHDNFEKFLVNIPIDSTCVHEFWDIYQKLSVPGDLAAFQPKVAIFVRDNLSNPNHEVRMCALQLVENYFSNGLFTSEKYADISVLVVDSAFSCKNDGARSEALWLKLVTVFLALNEQLNELLKSKTTEVIHILSAVLNTDSTSESQKAKAFKMFQIYVKSVNYEAIDDIFPIWQNQIIPRMFNLQTDALDLATNLLPWAQKILQKQNLQWDLICSDIQKKYIPILLAQICNKNIIYATLWIFLIKLLTCKLHKGLPVINSLLSVVETAFKDQDTNIRIEAFHCWQGLIDCFKFVPQEVYTEKRVKLLLIPLKTNNCKTEELIIAKFETWCRLLRVLHLKNAIDSNVIGSYLNFGFGPLSNYPLQSYATPGIESPGKKYPMLHYNSCLAFLQLLGDDKYFTGDLKQMLSQSKFVRAKISPKLFNSSSKTIIYSVGEACILLSQLDKGECKALNEALWKSLFLMIDTTVSHNNMVEEVTAIILAIFSMARKKPDLVSFGVLPIIKIILTNEFQFISNEIIADSFLVPFFGLILKKDPKLLLRFDASILKSIFVFKRLHINYLIFMKNIFYKNALSLNVNLPILEQCHLIWFLILDELTLQLDGDDPNNLDLLSCYYELFKWPLSTLNTFYNEKLILTWKNAYKNYAERTVSFANTSLAKLFIEYAFSLTEQNPELICIAEFVHFILININLQHFANDNFETIYDIITYLKQIVSLATLTADSANIYQNTVTHLLENTATLPYLPRIIAPIIDILRNIINKHDRLDVTYALKSFVNTVPYSPELHAHIAQIHALIKPLQGHPQYAENASIITKTIETKMKNENVDLKTEAVVRIFGHCVPTPSKTDSITTPAVKSPLKAVQKPGNKTHVENDTEVVYVSTQYKFDPKKLTKTQKRKLSRRRDDIPALYSELSQSQTRDFDSNSESGSMPVLVAERDLQLEATGNLGKSQDTTESSSQNSSEIELDTSMTISETESEINEPLLIDDSTGSSFISDVKPDAETVPKAAAESTIIPETIPIKTTDVEAVLMEHKSQIPDALPSTIQTSAPPETPTKCKETTVENPLKTPVAPELPVETIGSLKMDSLQVTILQNSKRKRKKPSILSDFSMEMDEAPLKTKRKSTEKPVRKRVKLDQHEQSLLNRQKADADSNNSDKIKRTPDILDKKPKKKRQIATEIDDPVDTEVKSNRVLGRPRSKAIETPDADATKLKKKRQKLESPEDIDALGNPTLKNELNRLRIDVIAEHEYKNIEPRKTRSGILRADTPTVAPIASTPKTRQLTRQKPDPDTDSEPIIENTQEVDHHLKHCQIPLRRIEAVKPGEHLAIGNGNRSFELVKGPQVTSPFKIIRVKNDGPQLDDETLLHIENIENPTPEEQIEIFNIDSTKMEIIGEPEQLSNKSLEMSSTLKDLKTEEKLLISNDSTIKVTQKIPDTTTIKSEFNAEDTKSTSSIMSPLKTEPELSDTDEYDPDLLNTTDTQTISTLTLDELNANAVTPVQDDICRQVILDLTDEDIPEAHGHTSPIPESDIPTSPIQNDTPTRNRELLRSTVELSPIRKLELIFPEHDEPKLPDISPVLFNSETSETATTSTDKSEKPSTSFSKRSSRTSGSRGALIMDMVKTNTGLNYSPVVKRIKPKVKKHVLASPSVPHNRISKMMEQFEKSAENLENVADTVEEICEADIFTFSRNLPSPTSNPAAGILRKRKKPDTSDDNIEPAPKHKRVNFADPPVSCRKFIEKNAKQKFSPELKQLDIKPNEPRVLRSNTQNLLENTEIPLQINDNVTETADKTSNLESNTNYNSQFPICTTLVNCTEPIMHILPNLTTPDFIQSISTELDTINIKTIGNLAQCTELQIYQIPLNVETVKTVLNDYKSNLTPIKPTRKMRPISFKFDDPTSCEVSVITSSNRDDADSAQNTDFPDDASSTSSNRAVNTDYPDDASSTSSDRADSAVLPHFQDVASSSTSLNRDDADSAAKLDFLDTASDSSEESITLNLTAGQFTDLSPNSVRESILGEEILGANVQTILLSIIRVLNEKKYNPRPLLQMLFGGISDLTNILVSMGTIRVHHLATMHNWKDIISDVISQIGVWKLMRLLCRLPQVPQALMFTALFNNSLNDIDGAFICEHLDKDQILKYVCKRYELCDIINEYDVKTIRQGLKNLLRDSKYRELNFKSILREISYNVIDNPSGIGVELSKLTVIEIGESIVQRFGTKVDLNDFMEQIYALAPPNALAPPAARLLGDLDPNTSVVDPISLTLDMIETRSISRTTSIHLFNCLADKFTLNELTDLFYAASKKKM